jgi:hypothetical protein
MFGPLQSLVEQYNTVDFRGGYYKVEFVPRVGLNTPGMITMALTSDPTDSFTATFEELSVLQQSRTGHVHKKMSAPLPTAALVGPRGGKYTVSPSSPYSGVGWAGAYVESEPDTLVGSLFAIYRFRLGERVPPPPRELHAKTGSLQHHNFSGVASNADDNIPRDTFRKQAYNVYANIARGMYLAYGIPMSTYGFSEADLIAPWDDDVCIKVAKMILPQVKSDLDGHIDFASGGFGEPVLPLVVAPEAEIEHLEVGMYSRSLGFTNGYAGNLFQASNVLYEQVDGSLAPVTAPSVVEGHYQTNITNDANGHYDIVKIHGDEFNRNSFTDTRHPGSNLREHDVINVRIGNGAVNVDPDAADSVRLFCFVLVVRCASTLAPLPRQSR